MAMLLKHPHICENLAALFAMREREVEARFGTGLYSYFRDFFSGRLPHTVYVEKVRLMARLTRCDGGDVLDVGCGHGFVSCLLEAFGARRSVGIDIKGSKIDACREIARFLGCQRTEFVEYDGTRLPFGAEYDAVCISAALSHVSDITATLLDMRRVMWPGARFYCFEDNNALHYKYRSIMQPVWDHAELGTGRPGHAATAHGWVPYRQRRAAMIRGWFPSLDASLVTTYAEATMGLVGDEIRRAVASASEGAPIVVDKPFRIYAPDTGEAMEYPFTPPMLAGMVREVFGNAAIHSAWTPPWRGPKGMAKLALRAVGALVPPLAWRTQPTFIVTATRDEESG